MGYMRHSKKHLAGKNITVVTGFFALENEIVDSLVFPEVSGSFPEGCAGSGSRRNPVTKSFLNASYT